jgi:hypothetical protein
MTDCVASSSSLPSGGNLDALRAKADTLRRHKSDETSCYLCLEDFDGSVVAEALPCGHPCCASPCTEQLVASTTTARASNGAVLCGVCRQSVDMFAPTSTASRSGSGKGAILFPESLLKYNADRLAADGGDSGTAVQSLRDSLTPSGTRFLSYGIRNFRALPLWTRLVIVLALALALVYLFTDRFDVLTGFSIRGLADDAVVVWWCLAIVIWSIRRAFVRHAISTTASARAAVNF